MKGEIQYEPDKNHLVLGGDCGADVVLAPATLRRSGDGREPTSYKFVSHLNFG